MRLPARRDLILGGFVAVVAIAHALDLSFAAPFLNFLIVLFALCAGGALALALFGIQPRWLGMLLGLLGVGAWIMGLLWILVFAVFDGDSPSDTAFDAGLLCRRTVYGFVAGDSGQTLSLYRRHALIDHRIHDERRSDIYPSDPPLPPAPVRNIVERCRALPYTQH